MTPTEQIIGHAGILRQLQEAAKSRPHHAYLFVGPEHIGKSMVADHLARLLLCETHQGCGACAHCLLVAAGNHPDYHRVSEEKLGIDDIRKLKSDFTLTPHSAPYRVAVMPGADRLGIPAQNAILKLLEEPPGHTVLILTAPSEHSMLPTTVSRCQLIRFGLPTQEELQTGLGTEAGPVEDAIRAAGRRPGLAKRLLADESAMAERGTWEKILEQVVNADAAERLRIAGELAKDDALADILESWLALHQEALHGEITDNNNNLSSCATTLARMYTEPQLRHNITSLFDAIKRLRYNPNVQLLAEQTLLTLGE